MDTDEEFLKYQLVPTMLNAIGTSKLKKEILCNNLLTVWFVLIGISDDSGVLADTLYDKYFSYAVGTGQEGNFTFLAPGIVDVIYEFICIKVTFLF